jgi:LysM repeat protein
MGQSFDPERIFDFERGTLRSEEFLLKKHYFSINSHYGQTDQQSLAASKKTPKDTASSSKKVYYKVRKGDNLGKIAKKHGTTVSKICKLNGIRANKVLKVGQTIRVK